MKTSTITKILIILLFITNLIFPNLSYSKSINPSNWIPDTYTQEEVKEIVDTASIVVSVIRVAGVIVTVIVLLALGIKYMTGSVSEKAEYKKSMIPYVVGAVIFFGLSQILSLVISVVTELAN